MLAWALTQNFIDPSVLFLWLTYLVTIFLLSLTFYVLGGIVYKASSFNNPAEMFFLKTTVGMASFCFISLPFFILNVYSLFTVISILLLVWVFGVFSLGKTIFTDLRYFVSEYKFLLFFFTIVSYVALLPPYRYDEMSFHLPYIMTFAEHSGVVTDGSMRHPLYTFNWHILQTAVYFIGNFRLCHLLTWSASVLVSFGIYGLLKRLGVSDFFASISALSFFFTPLILRYSMIFCNDVPLMLFLLSTAYSLYVFSVEKRNGDLLSSLLICAMFVGMKIINIVYIPVIATLVFYWIRPRLKHFFLFLFLFLMLSSVWYVRNIIVDGDPVPPTLNYALGRTDRFWSIEDYKAITQDINPVSEQPLMTYATLPWLMVNSSTFSVLRDHPVFLYGLFLPVVFFYFFKSIRNKEFIIWGILGFSIVLWLSTSYLIRYAHYVPLLIVLAAYFCFSLLQPFNGKHPLIKRGIFFLFIYIMFGPGYSNIRQTFGNVNVKVPVTEVDMANFAMYGKPELIHAINKIQLDGLNKGDTVYALNLTQYKYYFMKQGYRVVGDVINKWRFSDFEAALTNKYLVSFLTQCGAKAVFADKGYLRTGTDHNLENKWNNFVSGTKIRKVIEHDTFWIVLL